VLQALGNVSSSSIMGGPWCSIGLQDLHWWLQAGNSSGLGCVRSHHCACFLHGLRDYRLSWAHGNASTDRHAHAGRGHTRRPDQARLLLLHGLQLHAGLLRHLLQDCPAGALLGPCHASLLQHDLRLSWGHLGPGPCEALWLQDNLVWLLLLLHEHHWLQCWGRLLLTGEEHLLRLLLLLQHDHVWLLGLGLLQLHYLLDTHVGPEGLLQLRCCGAHSRWQSHGCLARLRGHHVELLQLHWPLRVHRPHHLRLRWQPALHQLHRSWLPSCNCDGLVLYALGDRGNQLVQRAEAAYRHCLQRLWGGWLGDTTYEQVLRQPARGVPLHHVGS
jgi:hypothetical protein